MSGDIIRHVVPNGEIGEVVYEQVGGSVVVDWPGCWRSTVPAHWYEVVESG